MSAPSPRHLAALAFAVLACCAAGAAMAAKKKEGPRECVANIAELTVVSLEQQVKKKKGKFVLGKKSECLVMPDAGNLPAVLVELPQFTQPYAVNIRSLLGGTVLAPRVDMLDVNKTQRRSFGLADLKSRGDSLSVDIFINDDNADERYLVLYPDPSAFGHGESRSSMGMQTSYVGTGYWISGTDTKRVVTYVDAGTLIVALKGPQWEKKD
jgi:hypothetical protein